MDYPNYSVFLSDNSSDESFRDEIQAQGIECGYVNPIGKINMEYMAESHEQCRQKAIECNADYMLHWEVDLFSDNKYIIQDLLYHNLPVVGCTYHIENGASSHLCLIMTSKQRHEAEIGLSTFPLLNGADMMAVDGKLLRVFNCGLGCTLIHRDVFTQIKFRWDVNQTFHPDSSFAEDCFYKGIPIYADTSLLLDHQNQRWLHY